MAAMDELFQLYRNGQYPNGMSSLNDPNNPNWMSQYAGNNFPGQQPARQPAEVPQQAFDGGNVPQEQQQPQSDLGQGLNGINPYLLANLASNGVSAEDRAPIEQNIAESKKGLQRFQDYQNAITGMPMQTDLSPLLALSDSLTGSKLAGSYAKPQTGEEKIGQLSKLQGMGQEERQKITDSLTKLATGKNQQRLQSALITNDRQQKAAASKIIGSITNDKLISAFDLQNSSIQKGKSIMDDIKAGKRKWDDNTKNELESDFATSLLGTRNIGLGSQERQTFNPYDARFAKVQSELAGHKINFEDPNAENSYLSQLEQNFNGLDEAISGQKSVRANKLLDSHAIAQSGNQYAQNVIKSLRGQYTIKPKTEKPVALQIPTNVDPKKWEAATIKQRQDLVDHLNGR